MVYNLSKFEEDYNVKLDSTQKEVLSNLINFVTDSEESRITLCAPAGSGKSTCLKILYDILVDNGFVVACVVPTNKAKSIFNNGQYVETIHTLLNLQPNLDILDFDATNLQFKYTFSRQSIDFDVLIIDECSMINKSLYDFLLRKYQKSKIIFCGDPKQLACIEDKKLSRTFDNKCLYLTTVYRQRNSIVSKVIEYLRNKPIKKFKTVEDTVHSIIVYNSILDMINTHAPLFKLAGDFSSTNLCKLITYSNKRITVLNSIIRSKLYNDDKEYHKKEILTAYDTYKSKGVTFLENSVDYFVIDYEHCFINDRYPGYRLTLTNDSNSRITIDILSRKIPQWALNKLAEDLEYLRFTAIKSKKTLDWIHYHNLYESFATPVDLVYDNRVVKRKTIDYGYCISVYKSQGSGYQTVMIDMENINYYAKGEQLRQLQYVACSRTMSDLLIYQKR